MHTRDMYAHSINMWTLKNTNTTFAYVLFVLCPQDSVVLYIKCLFHSLIQQFLVMMCSNTLERDTQSSLAKP